LAPSNDLGVTGATPLVPDGLAQQVATLQAQLESLTAADSEAAKTLSSNAQIAALLRTQMQQLSASLTSLNQAFSELQL
jgi:prefoldin subunit 5